MMNAENNLKSIINECVRSVLNENLKCSINYLRQMYLTMSEWQKLDCPIEGFDEFKLALDNAIDKLGEVVMTHQTGHRYYSVSSQLGK